MTEVTRYTDPHYFGAPSRKLLASSPAPRTLYDSLDFVYPMSFPPPSSQPYFGPTRPSLGTRSSSVSSSSSSASYNVAHSRTLSPALPLPDTSIARVGTPVTHHQHQQQQQHQHHQQQLLHHSPYVSQVQSPFLYNSPSQYLQPQAASQFPISAPTPTPRSFPQVSNFGYPQRSIPPHPSQMSYPVHSSSFQPFATYQAPSEIISSYNLIRMRQLSQQQYVRPSVLGGPILPEKVLRCLVAHLDYLDVIRLSQVNRWLYNAIKIADWVPEEDKIALVLKAEQEYKRYSLRTSSAPDLDHLGRDSGYLGCYHCFRMRPHCEFELMRYQGSEELEDGDSEVPAPRKTPRLHETSNQYYVPGITRSSIVPQSKSFSDQTSPRVKETWGTRRFCIECGVRKKYYRPGALIDLRSEKQGKETRGRKGDKEGKEAKWICKCYSIHKKPEVLQCQVCNMLTPFSQSRGLPLGGN